MQWDVHHALHRQEVEVRIADGVRARVVPEMRPITVRHVLTQTSAALNVPDVDPDCALVRVTGPLRPVPRRRQR